jgi:hypothetical protein
MARNDQPVRIKPPRDHWFFTIEPPRAGFQFRRISREIRRILTLARLKRSADGSTEIKRKWSVASPMLTRFSVFDYVRFADAKTPRNGLPGPPNIFASSCLPNWQNKSTVFEVSYVMSATSVRESKQHSTVGWPVGDPRFLGSLLQNVSPSLTWETIPHLNPGDQACIDVHHRLHGLHRMQRLSP